MAICVGCGLEVVDGILQVDVDGTTINCGGSGLFVVIPYPGISTDACNGISLGTDGKIWSPCPEGIAGIDNNAGSGAAFPTVMVGPNNTYDWDSVIVTITNTSACCTVSGMISFQTGFQGTLDPEAKLSSQMRINTDGGGFVPSSPSSYEVFHNVSTTTVQSWASNLYDQVFATFTPGQVRTFQAQERFTLISGPGTGAQDGTVDSGNIFEIQWTLVPTQCGC
jgi:hypothetical protein